MEFGIEKEYFSFRPFSFRKGNISPSLHPTPYSVGFLTESNKPYSVHGVTGPIIKRPRAAERVPDVAVVTPLNNSLGPKS